MKGGGVLLLIVCGAGNEREGVCEKWDLRITKGRGELWELFGALWVVEEKRDLRAKGLEDKVETG